MAVKIRLARGGRKKLPFYRVVVADSRCKRDGKFIEKIGTYNPLLEKDNPNRFVIDTERAEYWLGTGATPSERTAILMIQAGIKGADKYKPVFVAKPTKAEKEAAAKAEAEAKAAEEAKAAAEAEKETEVEAETTTEEKAAE